MKSLILEASTEHALLAETDGRILHLPGGPTLSKTLGAHIATFSGPYDRIILGIGPGSFTGIRVIASMGQALAFGWNIPLYSVSSLTAFAPENTDDFIVAVDARSGGIYCQTAFNTPILLPLDQASLLLSTAPLITSPHSAKILQRLPHLSTRPWLQTLPSPKLMEIHASHAHPLNLHYLSNL